MGCPRILHVYKNYAPTPGGIETYVGQLARGLARRGASVTVLVTAPGRATTAEDCDGVRVLRAGRLGEVASTPLSPGLIRELGRQGADLVHLHVPYPVGELGYLLVGHARPLVVTYHSDVTRQWWARPFYQLVLRRLLRRAGAILATSPPYRDSSPVLRDFASRTTVAPLGVDLGRFQAPAEAVAALRARWSGAARPGLVLFVGRFRAYKGLPYLIDAVAGLPARLLLVGGGPAEPSLRAQIARRRLADQVVIVGGVSDAALPAYYAAADVVVLPSIQRSEAFGITLLEGMAAGRPVVSTALGTGTSWVNQHERTGLVVPPADPAALRAAIGRLLVDPALGRRYGEAGRARVAAEFTEERMVAQVAEVYSRVLT